jgi:integrase
MQRGNEPISQDIAPLNQGDQVSSLSRHETMSTIDSAVYPQVWMMESQLHPSCPQDPPLEICLSRDRFNEGEANCAGTRMNMADFVERVFIPRYVMSKKTAGRAHFQGILKHILTPERIARAVRPSGQTRVRLAAISGWPYLDEVPLLEMRPRHVQQLIQASMSRGYSSQTVTHLRNVIRIILSYASACGYFAGPNPAALVKVPSIAHKRVRPLTLPQLKQVFQLMRYPEEQIALFALLTDMNVAEICGLKWKHVNLFNIDRYGSGEPLVARTISVQMQIYRGEYRAVVGRRNRLVPIPELLQSALQHLKHRPEYNSGEDFVLASHCGTPVNPDNIAARRLKVIGKILDLSWLSWKVFHHTGIELQGQFGRYVSKELGHALTLKR